MGDVQLQERLSGERLQAAEVSNKRSILAGSELNQSLGNSISNVPSLRTVVLTIVAMVALAANAVLCRLALVQDTIDPATFTLVRFGSAAGMLWLILVFKRKIGSLRGSWQAAFAMFASAAAFSFAFITISAGAGALLLYSAVQATMVTTGIVRGERMTGLQWSGLVLSFLGLAALMAPGVSAPPLVGTVLMLGAGIAWGAYSLLGQGGTDPLEATAGNFLRAFPMAVLLTLLAALVVIVDVRADAAGLFYAALSGAIATGLGYTIWYAALPGLSAAQGASVQLTVPVIATVGGTLMIGEEITLRLLLSSVAILGGIALVVANKRLKT